MTLQEAQEKIDKWIHAYGGGYFSELTNLGILTEEVGELARWIVRVHGDQNMKESERSIDVQQAISDEMTDVLWVILCLANQLNINLTEALEKNFEKKTKRDSERHL